ncbi:sugar phosphate isomerase/epimerase family protein [Gottfriedia acidiceleris]|uniref:Sugar phosphate isomerase/epimerase n=1 Tax=Gottfriedia acidiceleris TaxID=371036 RepID=A0ABY4JNV7_9BACI|nr:sugar phosphate isomerase/epimerase family protein [Gottfriedia acidiceleris]UPM55534.1 sugar phosphate isomerase/epimerase [Gottfriedia acidiceleris]
MKIACSSQSFDELLLERKMELDEFFQYCSTLSFVDGIEIEDKHIFHPNDKSYLNEIVELSNQYDLPIVNLAFDCNFGFESEEKINAEIARVKEWVEVAKALHIQNFRLFAGWPDFDKEKQWNSMIRFVDQAATIVEEAGLTVVIENHNHGGFLSNSDDVLRMFNDLNRPSIKLLLDTGNYVDQLEGVLKTAHFSGHVHAKVKEITSDGEEVEINYPTILRKLRDVHYNGWLSIEYEGNLDPKSVVNQFGQFLAKELKETMEV